MPEATDHIPFIAEELVIGRVTPFLGAGVNLCGRPEGELFTWKEPRFLPNGSELAAAIAEKFKRMRPGDEDSQGSHDLSRISQWVSMMSGDETRLTQFLHSIFDGPFPSTPMHDLLAGHPARLRQSGLPANDQLIVSANYDDTLERAFDTVGEPYDLVAYYRGAFVHWPAGADRGNDDPVVIDDPQSYHAIDEDHGTVILKVHGLVHERWESFVITEDDYIDYLTRTEVNRLLPVNILNRLKRSSFLFLGYSLRDWNIRAILHALSRDQLQKRHWAILLDPEDVEQALWEKRNVRMVEIPFDEFVVKLNEEVERQIELEREPHVEQVT